MSIIIQVQQGSERSEPPCLYSYKYTSIGFFQDKLIKVLSTSINFDHTPRKLLPHALHKHTSIFVEIQQIQIIKVPDKHGPCNQVQQFAIFLLLQFVAINKRLP